MNKNTAIAIIDTVIDKVRNNPHANLINLADTCDAACAQLTYREFIERYLAQAKQLKTGQNLLKMGNRKIHKSVGIWNLPAVYTCPNCAQCQRTCYALPPQTRYPDVRISRFVNWLIVRNYGDDFIAAINAQIKRAKIGVIRIHESGDFYSRDYADLWARIANLNPATVFYYYTKSRNTSGMGLDACANTNRVSSLLPDGSLNYGDREYVELKARELNVPICPCGYKPDAEKCGLNCNNCQTEKYMLFIQHSG